MKLSDFLEASGWTKAAVARKLGISDPAVSKWDDIPEQHQSVLSAVLVSLEPEPKIVRKCHPKDLPDDELKAIIRTRSGTTDFDICQEHGWKVPEFNEAIAGWVKRNPYQRSDASPENGYDLSKYKKGDIV